MGRRKVDKIDDRVAGVVVDIYLESGDMTFSATVFGNLFKDKNGSELRHKIREEIKRNTSIEWNPVIVVEELLTSFNGGFVGLTKKKFWYGRRVDGAWLECNWVTDSDEEKPDLSRSRGFHPDLQDGEEFKIPFVERSRFDGETFYLPYSISLWIALEEIESGIKKLRGRFRELLGNSEGIKLLEEAGGKLTKLLMN